MNVKTLVSQPASIMSPWSINVVYLLINFAHKPTANHPITVEMKAA